MPRSLCPSESHIASVLAFSGEITSCEPPLSFNNPWPSGKVDLTCEKACIWAI